MAKEKSNSLKMFLICSIQLKYNLLDFRWDFETSHACSRKLSGVDVWDLLEGLIYILNVISFHDKGWLGRVEVILEEIHIISI